MRVSEIVSAVMQNCDLRDTKELWIGATEIVAQNNATTNQKVVYQGDIAESSLDELARQLQAYLSAASGYDVYINGPYRCYSNKDYLDRVFHNFHRRRFN